MENIEFSDEYADAPSTKYKSSVWGHFKFPVYYKNADTEDGRRMVCYEKVVCNHCKTRRNYSGNTTNLSTHLKRHHASVLIDTDGKSALSASKPKKACNKTNQTTLADFTKRPVNEERAKEITWRIGMYIVTDLRPFSTVEKTAFISLINDLEPRYKVPGRTHFADKVIPQMYLECKSQLESDLLTASAVAITSDGWTSRAVDSYITVTAHYISQEWKLISRVLQTNVTYESHTGKHNGEILSGAVKYWKLERELPVVCVTDNASNMIVAVREAGLTHVKCFAHTVNLASQRALKIDRVNRLLKKLRTIVVFFHRSTVANALLKQKQGMLQLPDHKLIQDVSTRWNSSFEMVERYLEQQPAVLSVLMSKDVRKTEKDVVLYETDLSNAEDLVVVLKPMKTITTILCDEKQPTISLIFPLKHQILQLMQVIEGDTAFVRDIKEAIIQDINKRYIDEEDYLLLTSAVDPRFLSLPQLDDERKLAVFSSLITKAATLVNSDKIMKVKQEPDDGVATRKPELPELPGPDLNQDKAPAVTPVTVKQESSAMEELFGDVFVTHVQPAKSTLQLLEEEVSVYKGEECIPLLCDPLEWWCENQYRFPLLPRLAKSLLCIPGTSVPSERIFSTAGDIVTAQRATLSCDHVNMLIFLKKNLKQ